MAICQLEIWASKNRLENVPFQHVTPVQKQSDWVCTTVPGNVARSCPDSSWWSAISTEVSAQPSSILAIQGCHVQSLLGHLCTDCADTSLFLLCFGGTDSLIMAWLVVGLLLENWLIFFALPFPMFSQMKCQCFPFCYWKSTCHCWCWIYSCRGILSL